MFTLNGMVPTGLRALVLCNCLTGLWLHTPSSRLRRFATLIHEYLILASMIWLLVLNIFNLFKSSNFAVFTIGLAGTLGLVQGIITTFWIGIHKRHLKNIITECQCIIKNLNFYHHQTSVLQRISKRNLFYLIVPATCISISMINAIYNSSAKVSSQNETMSVTSDAEKEIINSTVKAHPILIIFHLCAHFICIFKAYFMDALFLTVLCFVSEELQVLKKTLHDAMLAGDNIIPTYSTYKRMDLATWLQLQRRLIRLMKKINSLWSPTVAAFGLLSTLMLCFMSYSSVKMAGANKFIVIFLMFTMISIMRISLYCEAGHRLRAQGEEIANAACQSPWLHIKPQLIPGLHLIAMDCKHGFVMHVGPFFTLTFEFFGTVLGAVITYLVILLQFK